MSSSNVEPIPSNSGRDLMNHFLPNEILICILDATHPNQEEKQQEDRIYQSFVCRRWNGLRRSSSNYIVKRNQLEKFYRRLQENEDMGKGMRSLSIVRSTEDVNIDHLRDYDSLPASVISCCPNLMSLSIDFPQTLEETPHILELAMGRLKKLTSLRLNGGYRTTVRPLEMYVYLSLSSPT